MGSRFLDAPQQQLTSGECPPPGLVAWVGVLDARLGLLLLLYLRMLLCMHFLDVGDASWTASCPSAT